VSVVHWIIHPGYQGNVLNKTIDISLMFLAKPLVARPAELLIANYDRNLTFQRIGYGLRSGRNVRTFITSELFREFEEYISVRDVYGFPGDSGGPVYQRMNGVLRLIGIHTGRAINPSGTYRDLSYVQRVGNRELAWILKEFKKRRL
jgi:V8-like Glu-specific endopeptidase